MPGGRHHPALRPAGPEFPILGDNIEIRHVHQHQIQETEGNRRKLKTKKEHRNRLKTIIEWLKEEYPDYANTAGGVVPISRANIEDPTFFEHTNTEDLHYSGINVALIKAFLGATKRKKNGKMCSFSHLRKFHDSILFGAEQAQSILPQIYYQEIEKFLESYKKETVIAKREGNVDENDADQIPFALYQLIGKWAVEMGNVFTWTFMLCQWNCMARSASIDPLGIHNLSPGTDSFKITYDDSKSDGAGERVSPKNIYANPFAPHICPATALGIWLCIRNETFKAENDSIFLENGKLGSACHRYNQQLMEMMTNHNVEVAQYCRVYRAKSHGIRKGSATHATSGTTVPPPLPSVARRGEWSQGTIYDIYFLFAEPGDQYLGRCLAGLSPNSVEFSVLPPHFTMGMENHSVAQAMTICFGSMLELFTEQSGGGLVGVLLFLLGSVVFHMETFIRPIVELQPRHPFAAIPLLQYPDLVRELQAMLTVEPTPNMPYATGVPPHISHAKTLNSVTDKVTVLTDRMVGLTELVKDSIVEAIEARDVQGGIVTVEFLRNELIQHHLQFKTMMQDQLRQEPQMRQLQPPLVLGGSTQQLQIGSDDEGIVHPVHCYGGRYWQVPKDWQFPQKTFRLAGWSLWLNGLPGIVRPFRRLNPRFVSPDKKVKNQLKLAWQPIFQMMEQAPGLNIPRAASVTPAFINESFLIATNYLQTRAGYVWERSTRPEVLTVSSWSKHVQRSSIEKYGNQMDRSNLPIAQPCNAPHRIGRLQRTRRLSLKNNATNKGKSSACTGVGEG